MGMENVPFSRMMLLTAPMHGDAGNGEQEKSLKERSEEGREKEGTGGGEKWEGRKGQKKMEHSQQKGAKESVK